MREGISPFHPSPPAIFAAACSCLPSAWTRGSAISFNCAVRDQLQQLAVSPSLKLTLHFLLQTAAGRCHTLISSLKLHCSCSLPYIAFKPLASLQLFAANTSFSHFKLYCSFRWQTFAATSFALRFTAACSYGAAVMILIQLQFANTADSHLCSIKFDQCYDVRCSSISIASTASQLSAFFAGPFSLTSHLLCQVFLCLLWQHGSLHADMHKHDLFSKIKVHDLYFSLGDSNPQSCWPVVSRTNTNLSNVLVALFITSANCTFYPWIPRAMMATAFIAGSLI